MSLRHCVLSTVLVCMVSTPASSQVLDAARGPEDGCQRPAPPPQSEIVTSDQRPIIQARYFGATRAYTHGVLGDTIEAEGLLVRYDDGTRVVCDSVLAGKNRVFEDTAPRLVDLNGDGRNEVIAVASHAQKGARLEVYGYPAPGQDFQLLAATPYIGRSYRWLAPIGAADLNGDGRMEIAYIDRPHLAKTLRIWRYDNHTLTEIAVQPGYSNHKIGWPFIAGGIRSCDDTPEMILATANWSSIVAVSLVDNKVRTEVIGRFDGPESLQASLSCP
ncbi:FG-GAP repeat domain-containing protein [Coralliovum pocilloporae]|uniref:FG-GAP repeat domain-containing protein n=1 Tax=Coralliovum pocilloporae TaxID=3066369 RepID=UPI0033079CD9